MVDRQRRSTAVGTCRRDFESHAGSCLGSRVQPVAPVLAARKQHAGDIRHSNDVPPCDPPIRHRKVMRRHVPLFVHPG